MKTIHVAAAAALLVGIGACGAIAPAGDEPASSSPTLSSSERLERAEQLEEDLAAARARMAGPWRLEAPPEIRHDIVGHLTSSFRAKNTGDSPEVPIFTIQLRDEAGKVRARLSCAGPKSATSRGVEVGHSVHVWCVSHGRVRFDWTDVELTSHGW